MVDTIHDFDNTSFPCVVGKGAATNYNPNRVGGSLYGSWGFKTIIQEHYRRTPSLRKLADIHGVSRSTVHRIVQAQ